MPNLDPEKIKDIYYTNVSKERNNYITGFKAPNPRYFINKNNQMIRPGFYKANPRLPEYKDFEALQQLELDRYGQEVTFSNDILKKLYEVNVRVNGVNQRKILTFSNILKDPNLAVQLAIDLLNKTTGPDIGFRDGAGGRRRELTVADGEQMISRLVSDLLLPKMKATIPAATSAAFGTPPVYATASLGTTTGAASSSVIPGDDPETKIDTSDRGVSSALSSTPPFLGQTQQTLVDIASTRREDLVQAIMDSIDFKTVTTREDFIDKTQDIAQLFEQTGITPAELKDYFETILAPTSMSDSSIATDPTADTMSISTLLTSVLRYASQSSQILVKVQMTGFDEPEEVLAFTEKTDVADAIQLTTEHIKLLPLDVIFGPTINLEKLHVTDLFNFKNGKYYPNKYYHKLAAFIFLCAPDPFKRVGLLESILAGTRTYDLLRVQNDLVDGNLQLPQHYISGRPSSTQTFTSQTSST